MYSLGLPTAYSETPESPMGNTRSGGRNEGASSEMDLCSTGEKKGEKRTQRLCDMIGSALDGSQGSRSAKREVFRNIIRSLGYSLTPVAVAEIILLVGKVIASTGKTDKEQFEGTRIALVEAIDSLAVVNWDAVFLGLPQVDRSLKITSIEAFAFLVAIFHAKKSAEVRFPVEIGLQGRWQSTLSHALFLKWVVVSIAATSIPTLYQRIPLLVYLRNVEVPPDTALLETCPPLFPTKSPLTALWSNSQLVLALANIAIGNTSDTPSSMDPEQTEAERIAIELLKRPTVNFFDVFLGTLVKCVALPVALSRFLASVCMDQFWTLLLSNQGQTLTPANFTAYIRGLSCLSPSRFGSVVLASLYPAHADRVPMILAALQPDVRVLKEVLNGLSPPFCFHALHLAKSKAFSPALWLKERLKSHDFEHVVKDFMSFLMLVLCPARVFQQHQQKMAQPLTLHHVLRRLEISSQDLVLYLYVVAEALFHHRTSSLGSKGMVKATPPFLNSISAELYSIHWGQQADQPEETLLKDLAKLKHILVQLFPTLVGVLDYIQPTEKTTDPPQLPSRKQDTLQLLPPATRFSSQVDTEVHKQFTALFSGQLTCADMITAMEHMTQAPQGSFMAKVLDAVVGLLLNECWLLQKCPLPELAITAELLGCVLQSGILMTHYGPNPLTTSSPAQPLTSSPPCSLSSHVMALECVLDFLRKGSASKAFRFAVTVLEYCMTPRLALYPHFLHELTTQPNDFGEYFPTYVDFATQCLQALPQHYRTAKVLLDPSMLNDWSLPPSPQPVVHPEFSLTRYKNAAALKNTPEHVENALDTPKPPLVPLSSDGVPPQRPLEVDGCPIVLNQSGLGSVEKLLTSDPALRCVKPPTAVCDQMAHLLNSLVMSNVQHNANELRNLIQPQWHAFFALSIVRSRIAKEVTFHGVYLRLIEAMGRMTLMETVLSTTYDCINILLCYCDSAKEYLPYRKYLKNLGAWLGLMSLALNKPLNPQCLDLKNLLVDGYRHNRLVVVLPLSCKIVETLLQSRPSLQPNSWSVTLLSLLAEIHALEEELGSLVFEVELLFKNLGLNLTEFKNKSNVLNSQPKSAAYLEAAGHGNTLRNDLAPPKPQSPSDSTLQYKAKPPLGRSLSPWHPLKQHPPNKKPSAPFWNSLNPLAGGEYPLSPAVPCTSPDRSTLDQNTLDTPGYPSAEYPGPCLAPLTSDASLVRTFSPPLTSPSNHYIQLDQTTHPTSADQDPCPQPECSLLKTLMKSVVISPSIVLFRLKPVLKSVIPQAIENAIREIVQVVAERSVTISCVTAKEIVLRDFSAEANENLVRRAAQLFVASLAGSIALVTCREPLRAALNQHIRNSLLSVHYKLMEDQRLVDQVVSVTTADNIELACALVEEAVVQLSVQKVKELLYPALVARQHIRQPDGSFLDPSYPGPRCPSLLPPALLPRPIVSGEQLEVYKDFFLLGTLQRMQRNNASSTDPISPTPKPTQDVRDTPPLHHLPTSPPSDPLFPPQTKTTQPRQPLSLSAFTSNATPYEPRLGINALLMRVEESLSHIKDMVYEIAFSSPTIKSLPSAFNSEKMCLPLGCMLEPFPMPQFANVSVATLAWLPSDHDIFSTLMNTSLCCSFYKDINGTFLSVFKRTLRIVNEFSVFYRETPAIIRVSNVAGLYLEVFLALLGHMKLAMPSFQSSCDDIIADWLAGVMSFKFFGSAVAVSLLRYQLVTPSKLDSLLAHSLMDASATNAPTLSSLLDSCLRLLFLIAHETCFQCKDTRVTLRDFKKTCGILHHALESRGILNAVAQQNLPHHEPALQPRGEKERPDKPLTLDLVLTMSLDRIQHTVLYLINQKNPPQEDIHDTPQRSTPHVVCTLLELLDAYATVGNPIVHSHALPAPMDLTPSQHETMACCFQQWMATCCVVGIERRAKAYALFFQCLAKQQFLSFNEETDMFLTGCLHQAMEMVKTHYPREEDLGASATSGAEKQDETISMETVPLMECSAAVFRPLNSFAKLIVALMDSNDLPHISSLLILQRTMSIILRSMYRDMSSATVSSLDLQMYYGILLNLLWEVTQPNKGLDQQTLSILVCFCNTFLCLSPMECPRFVFFWLELIAHSSFLPPLLAHVRAWPYFAKLIARLLRFLYSFQQKVQSSPGVLAIFKGTLRLLLVFLHDFPEFLCEYYVLLTENIPLNCIQLRNLILSAFPRNTALPDPFIPNLKAYLLPEARKAPRIYGNFLLLLSKSGIKQHLDTFQRTQDTQQIKNIVEKLKLHDDKAMADTGLHYNISLINAMFLYLVSQVPLDKDILNTKDASDSTTLITQVTFHLIEQMDAEGRYITISCMSNNLRYPNMHTHHFSCLILWLFNMSASLDMVQEQITRVLLERLIAHRPHPWGLLITFIQLMKNTQFNFWSCPFIHTVSDVQYLFQSVAQTCLNQTDLPQNTKI